MKNLLLLLSLIVTVAVAGCNTLLGRGNATAELNKQNALDSSTPAPMVHTISTDFSRVVVVRLRNGVDVLDGLEKAVRREGIKNAVILSGIGSLTSYHIHVVDSTTLPAEEVFPKADAPQDLLNVNGYVVDGRVHAHITFSDEQTALGGHLEPGTRVLTFAIVTLGILDKGADLSRVDDWTW